MEANRQTIQKMELAQRKAVDNRVEKRLFSIEYRDSGNGRTVAGYAALFNSESEDLGGFYERIAPGAFDGCLVDDVRCLFNHDPNQLLARTKSGTMRISADERGLRYEFDLPNTSLGRDLGELLARGDVSQSSFAFTIPDGGDVWEKRDDGRAIRTITRVARLYDVSPVTYPAYPDTEVALRSMEQHLQDGEAPVHSIPQTPWVSSSTYEVEPIFSEGLYQRKAALVAAIERSF